MHVVAGVGRTPSSYPDSSRLVGLLIVAGRLAQEQVAQELGALGLSYAQASVLLRLYGEAAGSLAQAELIEALALSRPFATTVLGQLQRRGLVTRTFDPGDLRRQVVDLTGAGRALEAPVRQAFADVDATIRGSLEPSEVRTALDVLRRVGRDLHARRRS